MDLENTILFKYKGRTGYIHKKEVNGEEVLEFKIIVGKKEMIEKWEIKKIFDEYLKHKKLKSSKLKESKLNGVKKVATATKKKSRYN